LVDISVAVRVGEGEFWLATPFWSDITGFRGCCAEGSNHRDTLQLLAFYASPHFLPYHNIFNESYALDIGRKCKAVQRQNINDGKFVGRMAPYGYEKSQNDCHKLVIDTQAASVVKQIFDWAASGIIASEITRKLNEANIDPPSRYKKQIGLIEHETLIGIQYWKRRTVVEILNDMVYIGHMVQGKTRKINHKQVNIPRTEWVTVNNTHDPIIDKSTFERVQELRKTVAESIPVKQHAYSKNIFAGKVRCSHCGLAMIRKRQKNGTYWFRCESQFRYAKSACKQVSIKEDDLKEQIITLIQQQTRVLTGEYVQIHKRASAVAADDSELKTIQRELEKSGFVLKSLYESLVSALITTDEFSQMKSDYEHKIKELSDRADAIRREKRATESEIKDFLNLSDAVFSVKCRFDLTAELVDKLIDKILVSHDKSFEIVFKFRDEMRCAA
jgi:hypothetical protein